MLLNLRKSSHVGVISAQGFVPPIFWRGLPLTSGKRIDAIHRTGFKTLVAARAQLGENDDVDAVVENGTKVRRASSQAGVATYALRHIYEHRRVGPFCVSLSTLDPRQARWGVSRCHLQNSKGRLSVRIDNWVQSSRYFSRGKHPLQSNSVFKGPQRRRGDSLVFGPQSLRSMPC